MTCQCGPLLVAFTSRDGLGLRFQEQAQPGKIYSGVLDPMPSGYRGIILATVGWLIVSAAPHPNPKAEHEQAKAQQSISSSLGDIAAVYREQAERSARPPQAQPCGPRQYQSKDDLCAQWKAADAASDASWWAKVGGFTSAISALLVLVALYAAFRSNWIARDSSRRELRAYLRIDIPTVPIPANITNHGHVELITTNYGQTPAYDMRIKTAYFTDPFPFPVDHAWAEPNWNVLGDGGILHPNDPKDGSFPVSLTPEQSLAVIDPANPLSLIIVVRVDYRDAFESERVEQVCAHIMYAGNKSRVAFANRYHIGT